LRAAGVRAPRAPGGPPPLAAEAQRLREWIGADPKIRITPRFRTPLERELSG
jgi:hypothetical protein